MGWRRRSHCLSSAVAPAPPWAAARRRRVVARRCRWPPAAGTVPCRVAGRATHARLSRQIVTDQAVHRGPVHGWCVLCPRGCVARVLVWNSRYPALCQRTPPRLKTRFEKKRAGPVSLWIWSFATLQGNLRALYSSFSLELACMATCTFPPAPRHEVPRRHSTGCCSQDYVQRHQPAIVA